MTHEYRFCPRCATPLSVVAQMEDGGEKARLRCPACDFTHWNNPTPVLAAVIEYDGQILLARNAATLLGAAPQDRSVRIMVTLPSEAAHDAALIDARRYI